jgi:cytochrome c-type biogenesis protein CcmH/NrfG
LIWSLFLLFLFFGVIRTVGEWSRPTMKGLDCTHSPDRDVPTLERCLEVHPDSVEILMDLGGAYERADEWGKAEAIYRRSLAIDGDDGDVHIRLGKILLRQGDAAGAQREAEAALAVQPGGAAALDLLKRSAGAPTHEPAAAALRESNR